MAYVVTQACEGSKFTNCVDVCPVDAFREGPQRLFIDPEVCIDCNACLTECPVRAIYPDRAVPEALRADVALNARESKRHPLIARSREAGARDAASAPAGPSGAAGGAGRRFAVIGAGPSGFYATEELLRRLPAAEVDLVERLPTPFGLVRYGVAPDHPKIKSIAAGFEDVARDRRVRFFGNVQVGQVLQREELLAHYDAVIYATGGSVNRELALPGAELANVHGASALVGWYNGHPDFRDLRVDLSGETAAIVGVGNVALDVARILTTPVAQLARTDIADHALEALRHSRIREVCILARRGPLQAAFTPMELRQLLDMADVDVVVEADDLVLDAGGEGELADPLNIEARENLALLRQAQARSRRGTRTIRFRFKLSPTGLQGAQGRVRGLDAVVNTLHRNAQGGLLARPSERTVRLPADLVVNATGYLGVPIPGLAFDARRGVIANREGRAMADGERLADREYVAGWIKRGASGVIGSNRQCAAETVDRLLEALASMDSAPGPAARPDLAGTLAQREVEYVGFEDWLRLDAHERVQGRAQDRPRRKEVDPARMLEIMRTARAPGGAQAGAAADAVGPEPAGAPPPAPEAGVKTHFRTCPLCEAMCGIRIDYRGERVVAIAGDPDDPLSRGHICPKGYALLDLHHDPDRLKTPLKRVGGQWIPIGWDQALQEAAEGLAGIQVRHGEDAVAAYWGNPTAHNLGIALTLERFRRALRTRNVYSASSLDQMPHQLVSYLMYGHSQLFTIPDIDRTDYMLMLGANPAASNGSLMSAGAVLERLQGITGRGGRLVLIDPRRTETALYASEHHFIQPGTDALFLLGLIQTILRRGLARPGRLTELVRGWDELPALLEGVCPDRIAAATGIARADIERIAGEFAAAQSAVCYGRVGVSTQEFGALSHWLIQVLNLLTGNLDRAGGMMFTTPAIDPLPASGRGGFDRYRSRVRGLPEFSRELPTAALAEEMQVPGEGQVRGFISIAGNPVLSAPNGRQLEQALERLEFMVAVDFYLNETTRHAHLILPPTGPLEHAQYDLIFNLLAVRNVAKYSEPLFPPPGDARSDWEIFNTLIRRIQRLKAPPASWLGRLRRKARERLTDHFTPPRILDLALRKGPYGNGWNPFRKGLNLARLKRHPHGLDLGPLRPCLPQRLFTKDRKIHLLPPSLVQDLERLKRRYAEGEVTPGLVLIGRRDLRTNNSWMHNSPRLVKGKDRCALLMHPQDAAARGVGDRDLVRVASARGELEATVRLTEDIKPGVVSLPHGWGHHRPGMRIATAQAHPGVSINDLTDERVLDVLSGNAVLSGVPVTVQPLAS